MKVEVVQGAKDREGEEMERLIQSVSFSLCSVAKIHTAAEICLAATSSPFSDASSSTADLLFWSPRWLPFHKH